MNTEFTAFAENAARVAAEMPVTYLVELLQDDGTYRPEGDAHTDRKAAADEYAEARGNGFNAIVWEVHCDGMKVDISAAVEGEILDGYRWDDYPIPGWIEGGEIIEAERLREDAEDRAHERSERFGWEQARG